MINAHSAKMFRVDLLPYLPLTPGIPQSLNPSFRASFPLISIIPHPPFQCFACRCSCTRMTHNYGSNLGSQILLPNRTASILSRSFLLLRWWFWQWHPVFGIHFNQRCAGAMENPTTFIPIANKWIANPVILKRQYLTPIFWCSLNRLPIHFSSSHSHPRSSRAMPRCNQLGLTAT